MHKIDISTSFNKSDYFNWFNRKYKYFRDSCSSRYSLWLYTLFYLKTENKLTWKTKNSKFWQILTLETKMFTKNCPVHDNQSRRVELALTE